MKKRRGHNEGTINQRKDGRWEAKVFLGYEDGKAKRKCFYGKTRQEVAQKLSHALAEIQKGSTLPNERLTLKDFLSNWLETTAKPRLRPRTYTRYAELINLHAIPALGRTPLARLTPLELQKFLNGLRSEGLSPRTIVQVRAVLRSALKHAQRVGMINRNVAELVEPPKVETYEPVFLTPEQAQLLLSSVKGHRLEGLVTMALATGMRMGELLGLCWSDIDFADGRVTIRRQHQRIDGEDVLAAPKTARSVRTLQLPDLARPALEAHRSQQQIDRLAAGERWIVSGRIFTNLHGGPLQNKTVLEQFHALLKTAGLPKMRLHDLRHSCATILLSQGVHPRLVMELLGHSTIAMTMNVYSHAIPSVLKETASAMDRALGLTTKAN